MEKITREEFGAMPKGESWNHFVDLNNMIEALQARIVELEEALKKSVDDLTWMSGANDFSPEGKAVKGWRTVQMHIERFNELLGEPK